MHLMQKGEGMDLTIECDDPIVKYLAEWLVHYAIYEMKGTK